MLTHLQARDFRCFDSLELELAPQFNFFAGSNGQGKTSILEAACVLLRLQSQRSASLAPLVRQNEKSFATAGRFDGHELRFVYSALRRKIEFDHEEQRTATEYLRIGRVVSFANSDIELVRGGSETRRRYLDFLGAQIFPHYRSTLRAYERALRARNALLKSAPLRMRELEAYEAPFITHGTQLLIMREALVQRISPYATAAHRAISGKAEAILLTFAPGASEKFADELAHSNAKEIRLRQTVVGPHRDDLEICVQEMPAQQFASEGQQRTIALALKIAQARVLLEETSAAPLLLVDDIFGELDPARRNALFAQLPADSQKFVTATAMDWLMEKIEGPIFHVARGSVSSS